MAGHVAKDKRTNKWYFAIEIGSPGARKRRTKKGFKTKTEARKAMNQALANLSNEEDITYQSSNQSDIRLGDYLDYWLEAYVKANCSPNTYKGYERMIRIHIKPSLGHKILPELTVRDIQNYYFMKQSGKKKLSAQTIRHHHRMLNKAMNDAVDWEFIEKNVVKKAKPPKAEKFAITPYSIEELKRLLEHAKKNEVYYPIIYVAAHTGARLGELRAISWDDVDFEQRKIYIRKMAYDIKGEGTVIKPRTKSGKERSITMGSGLLTFMEELKQKSRVKRDILGETFNSQDLVFYNSNGNPLHPSEVSRAFKKAIKSAKLPDIRFHDLRHTHATILLKSKVHPKVVSERLGHSKIGITMDTYSHVIPSLQDGAADIFDKAFSEIESHDID